MAKRVKFGDIIEIKTSKGYGYMQYTHKNEMKGNLIRVFSGTYTEALNDLTILEDKEIQFSSFFPLQYAVNQNIVRVVENVPIRKDLQSWPLFKWMLGQDLETNKAKSWDLWDGEKIVGRIKPPLTEEQKKLPTHGTINDTLLIERIESGWTPDQDPTI